MLNTGGEQTGRNACIVSMVRDRFSNTITLLVFRIGFKEMCAGMFCIHIAHIVIFVSIYHFSKIILVLGLAVSQNLNKLIA